MPFLRAKQALVLDRCRRLRGCRQLCHVAVPEQAYPNTSRPTPQPTQHELSDLNAAVAQLWALDDNRLEPGRDYVIDVQSGKGFHAAGDACPNRYEPFTPPQSCTVLRYLPTSVAIA